MAVIRATVRGADQHVRTSLCPTGGVPTPRLGVQHCRVLAFTGSGIAGCKLGLIYPWEREKKRATAENLEQGIADVARGQR